MASRTRIIKAYAAALILISLVMLLVGRTWVTGEVTKGTPVLTLGTVLTGLVFVLFISCAGRFPIQIATRTTILVDTSLIFALLLLFPMPWGPVVVAVGVALGHLLFWRSTLDALVNTGIVLFEGFYVQMIYLGLGGSIPASFDSVSVIAPLIGAGATTLLLERLLVSIAVAVYQGTRFGLAFFRSWAEGLKEDLSLLLLGVLTALVVGTHPWALALLVIPIALVYVSLRNGLQVKLRAYRALEELADRIDARDARTAGHSARVADLAERLAVEMGLAAEEVGVVRAAARVHDLGMMEVDTSLLAKKSQLSDEERGRVQLHPAAGADIVAKFPGFEQAALYVRYHHERCDGSGYPEGLREKQIPVGAAIIAVADAYDAMTSERAHRQALSLDAVLAEFQHKAGVQWREGVVVALVRILVKEHKERARPQSEQVAVAVQT